MGDDYSFLQEKIKDEADSPKRLRKKIVQMILLGVIFPSRKLNQIAGAVAVVPLIPDALHLRARKNLLQDFRLLGCHRTESAHLGQKCKQLLYALLLLALFAKGEKDRWRIGAVAIINVKRAVGKTDFGLHHAPPHKNIGKLVIG